MNMTFLAFEDVSSIFPSGSYKLQLNPEEFKVGFVENKGNLTYELPSADGQIVESSEPLFSLKTWDVKFTIDNTGAIASQPPSSIPIVTPGLSIGPSISYFNDLFVDPDDDTHSRKYIKGIWGLGSLTIFGRVKKFDYEYTFFTGLGAPLRASCSLLIEEVPAPTLWDYFSSPDITRIPKVKESDNMVDFCEKYYKDKNYYMKVAEHNNLPSFRKLKTGTNIEFPPIKK